MAGVLNNNSFPYPTVPNYVPQQQIPTPQQPMNQADMVWVQGKEAAKAYPVVRNGSVVLFDSERDAFYIKTTDASGMPLKLREFTYSEVLEDASEEHEDIEDKKEDDHVTRDDIAIIAQSISDLGKQFSEYLESQNGLEILGHEDKPPAKKSTRKTSQRKAVDKDE